MSADLAQPVWAPLGRALRWPAGGSHKGRLLIALLMSLCGPVVGASTIEELVVTATRADRPELQVPMALTVVSEADIQAGRQQLGLDESLARAPGVFFQDRYNFAQDLRISIRGFGSRAAFGIRGIRLFVDGIPATTPDGQGGVDSIDLGSVTRVELLRGPSSALYGSAAGGVISLFTEDGAEQPYLEGRVTAGDYDTRRYQVKGGADSGAWNLFGSLSRIDVEGYRDHSATQSTLFNGKARYAFDDTLDVTTVLSVTDSPKADDAGALTAAEALADPRQGRARNIEFDSGEELQQARFGVVLRKQLAQADELRLRGYVVTRDFGNRLPVDGTVAQSNGGQVELDRLFIGGGAEYAHSGALFGRPNRVIFGVDVDLQDDERQRYINDLGVQGALTFDQNERVQSVGAFVHNEVTLTEQLRLTVGGRYDVVEFDVDDAFLANDSGDDSGREDFAEFSPMMGFTWNLRPEFNLYGVVSTSFETPTTTEFANPGGGGFNPLLKAQTATNYEIGARGIAADRYRYDIALYTIDVADELVPFQQPGDERTFFENAGSSTRSGLELSLATDLGRNFVATVAYTYAHFTFDEFSTDDSAGAVTVFDGNDIPGNPRQLLYAELAYRRPSGFYAVLDVLHVGDFYADNANSVEIDGYQVANLRLGLDVVSGVWQISPFIGANNLFDETYNNNVRINGTFGRYFEPAPERNLYAGVSVRRQFAR